MKKNLLILNMVLGIIFFCFLANNASAADIDLAQKYSPVLYFEAEECCYPVDATYHIDNSKLYQFSEDQITLINENPTEIDIAPYSSGEAHKYFFLDNTLGTIENDNIIEDYNSKKGTLGYKIYSRVYSSGSTQVVQYWMFYAFNKGPLNIHEGDWEMVQVIVTNGQPDQVMFSQHLSGQKANWNQVDKSGDHVKVYVGRGTHANYIKSYSGVFGASSDKVGDNGKILAPDDDYEIELLDSQSWLDFAGRWGEYGGIENEVRGKVGPFGPIYRENGEMWNNPIMWGASLSAANDMIFLLEWFLYNFVVLFVIFTIISLAIVGIRIYLRYKKHGLGPRIISMLYIDGLNLKSIANILCIIGIVVALFGAFQQWYVVSMNIDIPEQGATGLVDMLVIDGLNGVSINLLESSGSLTQMGSVVIPFAFLIAIGLVFFIISTIGLKNSDKLGKKYISRGIKLAITIIVLLIAIFSIGFIGDMLGADNTQENVATDIFDSLSSQPIGGQKTIPIEIPEADEMGSIYLKWGIAIGGQLLLISSLMIIVAGFVLYFNHVNFYGNEEKPIQLKNARAKTKEKNKVKKDEKVEEIILPKKEESEE